MSLDVMLHKKLKETHKIDQLELPRFQAIIEKAAFGFEDFGLTEIRLPSGNRDAVFLINAQKGWGFQTMSVLP